MLVGTSAATVLKVLGIVVLGITITPLVMGVGLASPWTMGLFVLGVALLVGAGRLRRQDADVDAKQPRGRAAEGGDAEGRSMDDLTPSTHHEIDGEKGL